VKRHEQLRISKDFVKRLETIGLTKEQIAELTRMDRSSAIEWIKEFQSNLSKPPKGFVPEIGKHIEWVDIVEMVFRVLDFDRSKTVITPDGQVHASTKTQPYGYLLVESPTLNQPVGLPIIHKKDFLLASSVFDEPWLAEQINGPHAELLVTYAPKSIWRNGKSKSPWHALHYTIAPRSTLESYYSDNERGDKRMSNPEPEILFGPFKYTGEIVVGSVDKPNV